jgi:hypothetical protein
MKHHHSSGHLSLNSLKSSSQECGSVEVAHFVVHPPSSPDFTPLDFCGDVTDVVYRSKVKNYLSDLRGTNIDAVAPVTPEMSRNTWIVTEYWLDAYCASKERGEMSGYGGMTQYLASS